MDSERPIEKLLRQAAEARRAQAGSQELHPANRRMLQSEIARKFAGAAPEKRSFLELFIPRLAWSATVIVGLGLAASLMLPRQKSQPNEMFFAKNDRVSAPGVMNEALPPPVAAPKADAPSEAPALARADQYAYATGVAQAERDKDSLSFERWRAEGQRKQLSLNEPAGASPQGTTSIGGSLATEKQKEELVSRSLRGAVAPQTLTPQEQMNQRRYGLAAPAQSAPSSAASAGANAFGGASVPASRPQSGVADTSEAKPTLESAKSELAYKTAPWSTPTSASGAAYFNATSSAAIAKRSPAPIARVSQQFVQSGPLAKKLELADKSAVATPILASFELQQLGRQVRVVDSDGSVYFGNFQIPQTFNYLDSEARQKMTNAVNPAAPARELASHSESALEQKGALDDSKLQADLGYAFTVTGTNQTLKQVITFTGQILTPTNVLSLPGPAGTLNGNRGVPPELNPLPLGNSRISGKAVIGGNKEVEVNAIPAH